MLGILGGLLGLLKFSSGSGSGSGGQPLLKNWFKPELNLNLNKISP